jgi:hypothetical protein
MAGDVLVLDVGSLDATQRILRNDTACRDACVQVPGCNGWVYCNDQRGCGYTCGQWVTKHPTLISPIGAKKIDFRHTPILGFGPWAMSRTGCQDNGKAWPFGLCSLKNVSNPYAPDFYRNEMQGWLSGTLVSDC